MVSRTMTEEYETTPTSYTRSDYRGMLNYESILSTHIQRLMQYRDSNPKTYASSIETLIIHCPQKIRGNALKKLKQLGLTRGYYTCLTDDRMVIYDDLLIYINEQLEKHNLIFKVGKFEIGHD